jgi:hypothetical protein
MGTKTVRFLLLLAVLGCSNAVQPGNVRVTSTADFRKVSEVQSPPPATSRPARR